MSLGFDSWFLLTVIWLKLDNYDLVPVLEQVVKFIRLHTMHQGFCSWGNFHANDPQWRQSTFEAIA